MANRSTFPTAIDTFIQNQEISASDIPLLLRYQELTLKVSKSPSESDELSNLLTQLRSKLMTAEDYNHMKDAIKNVQTFFRDSTDGYIQRKQLEFQGLLDRFTHKGEFNSTIQYRTWNTVTYQGETYLALIDSYNQLPNKLNNTQYWAKIAAQGAKGDQGIPGVGLSNAGAWSATKQYYVDQVVQYNGQMFASIQNNLGIAPNPLRDTEYWTLALDRGPATYVTPFEKTNIVSISTTNVPINIPEFNVTQDFLTVIKNSTTLVKGINYKINSNGTSIDSLEGQWNGNVNPITFHFVVLKNFVSNVTYADGTMIQNNTISKAKLAPTLRAEIDAIALHKDESMPHKYVDATNNKTYKWGMGSENGAPYFIREEIL